MNKLTIEQLEQYRNTYDCFDGISSDKFENICDELIAHKKLEEQIGCSLEVLSSISNDGFYCDYGYIPPCRIHRIDIFRKEIIYYDEDTNGFVEKLCYYKQTFWLKKDRSE